MAKTKAAPTADPSAAIDQETLPPDTSPKLVGANEYLAVYKAPENTLILVRADHISQVEPDNVRPDNPLTRLTLQSGAISRVKGDSAAISALLVERVSPIKE